MAEMSLLPEVTVFSLREMVKRSVAPERLLRRVTAPPHQDKPVEVVRMPPERLSGDVSSN